MLHMRSNNVTGLRHLPPVWCGWVFVLKEQALMFPLLLDLRLTPPGQRDSHV